MKVAGSKEDVAAPLRFCARPNAAETKKTRRTGRTVEASANRRSKSPKRRLLMASTSSNRRRRSGLVLDDADADDDAGMSMVEA